MKKTQILIVSIVVILLLAVVTVTALYFATDIFRTNKQLFTKYVSQINLKEFINLDEYNNFLKKAESQAHSANGEFSVNVSQENETMGESIKYQGYSDPINKKSNYVITLNQNDTTLLSMDYLRDNDLYGILFNEVVKQYIVVENNNLKEFASKLGIEDVENIPDKIENLDQYINYEELKEIYSKYFNIVVESIDEDNFYKLEKDNILLDGKTVEADGYAIKLKLKDMQTILTRILNSLKNDEQVFNIISKIDTNTTFEEYQSGTQATIDELTSREISKEENVDIVTISVYKQGKNAVKLTLDVMADETETIELSIEKLSKGMTLKASIIDSVSNQLGDAIMEITKTTEGENEDFVISINSYDDSSSSFTINVSRTGALKSDDVTFDVNIQIPIGEEAGYVDIELKNKINFAGTQELKEFTDGNHLVINNLQGEQITSLFTNLGKLLSEKLKDEMFISMAKTMTGGLYEIARQAADETEMAIEQESSLSDRPFEINGQIYNNVEEYINSGY